LIARYTGNFNFVSDNQKDRMEKRPTVIYIISDRRSGSTLLENILSKSTEVVSVGELAMLQGHILKEGPGERWNWNCSCGEPVKTCVFWSPILKETYDKNAADFNTNISWNYKSKKLKAVALAPSLFKKRLLQIVNSNKNKTVPVTLTALYENIFKQSGKSFIADSSKDPLQALTVYRRKRNFDVKIIWLKRDLRAIAVSKSKWKELNVKKQKTLKKLLFDVFYYRRICEAVAGFISKDDLLPMQYEALAQQTQQQLDKLVATVGLDKYEAPQFMFVEDDHTIGGTPNRFEKRPIKYEEAWKKNFKNKKLLNFTGAILNKL